MIFSTLHLNDYPEFITSLEALLIELSPSFSRCEHEHDVWQEIRAEVNMPNFSNFYMQSLFSKLQDAITNKYDSVCADLGFELECSFEVNATASYFLVNNTSICNSDEFFQVINELAEESLLEYLDVLNFDAVSELGEVLTKDFNDIFTANSPTQELLDVLDDLLISSIQEY